jgi:hypothetical protein
MSKVAKMLEQSAATFAERHAVYGDNYKKFGEVCMPMLSGIKIEHAGDFNRLGILVQIISKLTRYCENFNRGGHDDSLNDLAVYTTMLRELDAEAKP